MTLLRPYKRLDQAGQAPPLNACVQPLSPPIDFN
jgi:hypothetical protein